jgi:ribonucleoside-diphosphate reductase alpha chain
VRSIAWRAHVQMMAAAQPFLSGAISKTVNMPRDTTPADIAEAYVEGWKLGLKALAIYRDGSKESQPLSTGTEADKEADKAAARQVPVPRRERLPDTRQSITHKFNVAGHEGYITVGLYDDGRPGELFITMAKEGSTIGGLMDCFGTAVSMSLQYGVPLEVYVGKFSHTRFEPMGHTKNPDIRIAKSIVDYIFRWLGITFIPGYKEANQGLRPDDKPIGSIEDSDEAAIRKREAMRISQDEEINVSAKSSGVQSMAPSAASAASGSQASAATKAPIKPAGAGKANGHALKAGASNAAQLQRAGVAMKVDLNGGHALPSSEQFASFQLDAPSCDNCGAITVRNGNCYLCYNCGNSMGCS